MMCDSIEATAAIDTLPIMSSPAGDEVVLKSIVEPKAWLHFTHNGWTPSSAQYASAYVYHYFLDRGPGFDAGVDSILKQPRGATVKLYECKNARDHYLGEFRASDYTQKHVNGSNVACVTLLRLPSQRPERQLSNDCYLPAKPDFRSGSEMGHYERLCESFPEEAGWRVVYEPCCTQNLYSPRVVDGKPTPDIGTQYTIDFIITNQSKGVSIWVESKCDASALDTTALAKCRALRDQMGVRVIGISGAEAEVYDFATCRGTECTVSFETFVAEFFLEEDDDDGTDVERAVQSMEAMARKTTERLALERSLRAEAKAEAKADMAVLTARVSKLCREVLQAASWSAEDAESLAARICTIDHHQEEDEDEDGAGSGRRWRSRKKGKRH